MEIVSPGIAVFRNYFLRDEEAIYQAESSNKWRPGTAGNQVNPNARITDIHDLDNQSEIHKELLNTFLAGMSEYVNHYKHLSISNGEHLRIGRYQEGGHYSTHADSSDGKRILSGVIYLNSDYEGGEIYFPNQNIELKPEAGMLLLFPSNFLFIHGSKPITKGNKYICVSWFS